jgi:hypothetical protein
MAYMTENTNLQRALLRRIAEVGTGKVDIREEARVQEMRMDEGKRSVVLKLGEEGWVRGGVVVSPRGLARKGEKQKLIGLVLLVPGRSGWTQLARQVVFKDRIVRSRLPYPWDRRYP